MVRQENSMGIGISLILIAAGAILTYALEVTASGVDLDAVGVILMVVGAIGLVFSLLFLAAWSPFAFGGRRGDGTGVDTHHDRI
jgi:hypothetical protein